MERLVFRLERTIRHARRLVPVGRTPLSLPGVEFRGAISDSDEAAVGLLMRAISGQRMYGYWRMTECCEGCVQNAQAPLRHISATFALAREAVTSGETTAIALLLGAAVEGLEEFRRYIRQVIPDRERGTQWGEGEREEYLDAMHGIREHLLAIIAQVHRLTMGRLRLPEDIPYRDTWEPRRYAALDRGPDLFRPEAAI